MNFLIRLYEIFCVIYIFTTFAGLVIYKFEVLPADSWEDAIRKMFPAFFKWCVKTIPPAFAGVCKWFYEEATGKGSDADMQNEVLILSNQEVLSITKKLDGHPYDTPSLNTYKMHHSIMWIEISAVRAVATYADLDSRTLGRIAKGIIQSYYMETRETQVPLYILKASPEILQFAVPLSENGQKYLHEQYKDITFEKSDSTMKLEEEIPVKEKP